jgi:flagellar L-ring protein FlgH
MMIRTATVYLFSALSLFGCASSPRDSAQRAPLVEQTSPLPAQPMAGMSFSAGSLVPVSQTGETGSRGFFADKRAAQVGDTLTVILNETTSATKGGSTKASRTSSNKVGADLSFSTATRTDATTTRGSGDFGVGLGSSGNTGFDSRAGSTQSNQFSGTITVTVLERLANGNLRVAGEKRLAVGAEEEVIRFGGIVSPMYMRGNTVLSSYVADARIEYRGAGVTDQVQRPGWLTDLFINYSPN